MEETCCVVNTDINIDTALASTDGCLTHAKSLKHLLHLLNYKFAVFRMSELGLSTDLEQRHTGSVVVNHEATVLADLGGGSILLHLHTLDQDVRLGILVVVVEKAAINHNWVVLLSDLISLG